MSENWLREGASLTKDLWGGGARKTSVLLVVR